MAIKFKYLDDNSDSSTSTNNNQTSPGPLSALNSALQGGVQGVMDYGSTLQKAVTPYTYPILSKLPVVGQYARSPQDAQSEYVQGLQDYQQNPDVQAHPYLAQGGRTVGNIAMTAPLYAAANAALPGSGFLPTLGRGVAGGMMQGAFMNSPQQGSEIVNKGGAAIGGLMGGLFAPVQYFANNQYNSSSLLQDQAQKELTGKSATLFDPNVDALDALANKTISKEGTEQLVNKGQGVLSSLASPSKAGALGGILGGIYGFATTGNPSDALKYGTYGAGLGTVISSAALKALSSSNSLKSLLVNFPAAADTSIGNYLINKAGQAGVSMGLQNGNMVVTHKDDHSLPQQSVMPNGQTIKFRYLP